MITTPLLYFYMNTMGVGDNEIRMDKTHQSNMRKMPNQLASWTKKPEQNHGKKKSINLNKF